MSDSPAKNNERWWARFLGGVRHPSQGVPHPDLSGTWFVAEHKYRTFLQYSAEFRKAISQHDINQKGEANKRFPRRSLLCLTLHGSLNGTGWGQHARRFLVIEVFNKDQSAENLLQTLLHQIREEYAEIGNKGRLVNRRPQLQQQDGGPVPIRVSGSRRNRGDVGVNSSGTS